MQHKWFDQDGRPAFSQIHSSDIETEIGKAITACKEAVEYVVQQTNYTYDNVVGYLEEVDDILGRLWSPISHLNATLSSDAWRQAHDACLPKLSELSTWIGQHEGLYQAYLAIQQAPDFASLSPAQQQNVNNVVRDFTLSGVALPKQQKQRYAEITARLSELASQFSNNTLDATMAWSKLVTDEAQLAGLPTSAIAAAQQRAAQKDLQGWLFTLDFPSYFPVITYADDRQLREEMYRAFVTRASDQGPNANEFDNTKIIEETLALRQELAQILGFSNYAEYSLATKMAESPQQVSGFINDLVAKSKPQALRERQEIIDFALTEYAFVDPQPWDMPYFAEKYKQRAFTISDEMLRPYFPEHAVVNGLFKVVERLFGIHVKANNQVDTYHPDVRFYDVYNAKGEHQASFYLDLFARENKRGGAWMDECRVRRKTASGQLQLPIAYLTCNFTPPVGEQPACFTHDEVITLFHEFGHGLHHMLTVIDVAGVSGINGVAWDAVELPSQFLENWCWEPEALRFISAHVETGASLPQDLLDKMLAAKHFQAGLLMLRQLEFSLFDFALHEQVNNLDVQAFIADIRARVAVAPTPDFNRFQNSFGHIFAGGYAAGYYSYKWAEVLSADAFARFEEEGIFNQQTGQDFLQAILYQGGSQSAMALFTAFRGRPPSIEALLRHSGIRS